MPSYRVQVMTAWVGSGVDGDEYRPELGDDVLYSLDSWSDVTGQAVGFLVPSPNVYVLECIVPSLVTVDALDDDASYTVLSSEEIVDG